MSIPAQELAAQLQGLLSFPVTPFTAANEVDLPRFREHIQFMAGQKPAGLFACGGTGEFYSLNLAEYHTLVRAAAVEAGGKLPIVAGVGYGTRLAIDFAKAAEEAGADGLMVMPPYLLQAEQEGLYQHYRAIAEATRLGVILYQRDNAIFAPATVRRLAEIPNVIGFKDGYGDMERLLRIRLAVGDRLLMLNGMPTAELSAPAFLGLGVHSYSSAVFNFVPEISWAFYRAATAGDSAARDRLLEGFFRPFAELRDRVKGYAVALVKAGVGITGRQVGPVRSPLLEPSAEHAAELKAIVERGLALVA
jgi:5-dehydro-4-deoxyglucarate dehydratase